MSRRACSSAKLLQHHARCLCPGMDRPAERKQQVRARLPARHPSTRNTTTGPGVCLRSVLLPPGGAADRQLGKPSKTSLASWRAAQTAAQLPQPPPAQWATLPPSSSSSLGHHTHVLASGTNGSVASAAAAKPAGQRLPSSSSSLGRPTHVLASGTNGSVASAAAATPCSALSRRHCSARWATSDA